ncbi:uncharacterized protein METZ01_LOCUS14894 [marine metagenome]|uniref:Uncharacterized protein n=1 Tax=marine metagenome TaxID=408172 RepID=A0A381P579_9ZZZZ
MAPIIRDDPPIAPNARRTSRLVIREGLGLTPKGTLVLMLTSHRSRGRCGMVMVGRRGRSG